MKIHAAIILVLALAFATTSFAEVYRFDGNDAKTNYLTTGTHLSIAGDGRWNQRYAVINADGSVSRYDGSTKVEDLTEPDAHSYTDLASLARLNGTGASRAGHTGRYWAMYKHGVDEIGFYAPDKVVNRHHDATVSYRAVAGDPYAGFAALAREDGGIDIYDKVDDSLDVTQGLSSYDFIDLSEYAYTGNSFYGLTDTALYQLIFDGANLTVGSTLATFDEGTYISVAGHSGWNDRGVLALADGGLDEFNNGISTYFTSDTVFPFLGTYGGIKDTGTTVPYELGHYYAAIPEPTTLALLGLGGLALIRRRNR